MKLIIKCKDCGVEFEFLEKDQKFYEEHRYVLPKRCQHCREIRKNKFNREEK